MPMEWYQVQIFPNHIHHKLYIYTHIVSKDNYNHLQSQFHVKTLQTF